MIGATADFREILQFSPGLGKLISNFTHKELFKIASEMQDWELFMFFAKELDEDDQKDENGFSPLHYAALQGHHASWVITELFSIVKDKNPRNNEGVTPLHILAANGCHLDFFNLILHEVDDKNPMDENGFTPLHYAADKGHLDMFRHILTILGKSILPVSTIPVQFKDWPIVLSRMTPLHLAAMNGHFPIVKYLAILLEDDLKDINPSQGEGLTVLHLAAFHGHIEIVSFYTQRLEDVNPMGNGSWNCRTPLHLAACEGHLDVVKHLCDKLRDKNPCDDAGMTPLHEASKKGRLHVVKYLVQHLADKEPKCGGYPFKDKTPLDLAKHYNHSNVTSFLKQFA